jgi:hypothetical protein
MFQTTASIKMGGFNPEKISLDLDAYHLVGLLMA